MLGTLYLAEVLARQRQEQLRSERQKHRLPRVNTR